MSPGVRTVRRIWAALLLAPVTIYRRLISPLIPPRCRYYPTCSSYAVQVIRQYGPLRGLALASWRLLRCNPWSQGGVDLPEDQRLFVARACEEPTHHHGPPMDHPQRHATY